MGHTNNGLVQHFNVVEAVDVGQWLLGEEMKGKLIFENGQPINHRIWFKVMLNPILRRFGCVIVSCLDDNNNVTGYQIRRYPFWSGISEAIIFPWGMER